MRRFAGTTATMVFFGMAMAGLIANQPSFAVGVRALVGAVVAYIVAALAFKFAVDVMLNVVVADAQAHMEAERSDEDDEEPVESEA